MMEEDAAKVTHRRAWLAYPLLWLYWLTGWGCFVNLWNRFCLKVGP